MPATLMKYHREHGDTHYCPNGHPQVFCKPEVPELQAKLREANQQVESLHYQLNGALDNLAESKKELRKTKHRANAGLCPHCRRHFVNVERHIHTKHPDKL